MKERNTLHYPLYIIYITAEVVVNHNPVDHIDDELWYVRPSDATDEFDWHEHHNRSKVGPSSFLLSGLQGHPGFECCVMLL